MDCFLLNIFNLQCVKFLVKNLHDVHHDAFMDLLPKMRSEDLNQGDLQCGDLSMHENPCQIQLDLEADVNVGTVDRWRPPQSESTVRNLSQSRSLGVRQLLEFHAFFKPRGLLPEQSFPSRKVSSFE